MIRLFGKLICWLRGRHKWSRAYFDESTSDVWQKYCPRCDAVAPVKRLVKKEKA